MKFKLIKIICYLEGHFLIPASFRYNDKNKIYYVDDYICQRCGHIQKLGL